MDQTVTETAEKVRNCTSEALEQTLGELTTDQIRFAVARQECATDKEAAEAVGISVRTVYNWPDVVKEAVRLMAFDGLVVAAHVRRRNLAKAMQVKVAGLDDEDAGLRQRVATEIIDWEMGKPTQHQEVSGPKGGPIETSDVGLSDSDRAERILAILDAARARGDRPPSGGDG